MHSFYNSLLNATSVSFPWQSIWCVKIPKRLSFFLWTVARGGILTIDNLVKKNLPLFNWCCLCQCDEETVDYLLLYCSFAHALWSEVFLLFGVQWVMLNSEYSCLSSFRLEELIGESLFKCLEYGTSMSYVVSIKGMQCLNF